MTLNYMMEPSVHADRERELVALDLTGTIQHEPDGIPLTYRAARTAPTTVEDCDAALAWVERMEAALDNVVSELRLIQERMLRARSLPNWQTEPDPSLGAGASVEAFRG